MIYKEITRFALNYVYSKTLVLLKMSFVFALLIGIASSQTTMKRKHLMHCIIQMVLIVIKETLPLGIANGVCMMTKSVNLK